MKIKPFLTPDPDDITISNWHHYSNLEKDIVTRFLPDWDPATESKFSVVITIDIESIYEKCGLNEDAVLRIGLRWKSPGTNLRGRGQTKNIQLSKYLPNRNEVNLECTLDGALLSLELELSASLILIHAGKKLNPIAAQIPGTVLWESAIIIGLEGSGSRFPMEFLDFSEHSWIPSNGVWHLDWDNNNFEQPALGALRLYLNKGNAKVHKAITGKPKSDADKLVEEVIKYDVARVLILTALSNNEFAENINSFEDDSLGKTLSRLIYNTFIGENLDTLRSNYLNNPVKFETKLQHHLTLWGEQ